MKTSGLLVLIALLGTMLADSWGLAQSTNRVTSRIPVTYDFGSLEQLASFIAHLQQTQQTNTLRQFTQYANAALASRNGADLAVTLAILERLKSGRTNEACELLEEQLTSDLLGFVKSYRELPDSLRERGTLKALRLAKDYRAQHPFKHRDSNLDRAEAEAFKLLEEQRIAK